jgi:multiple sugar transport system permease protein
MVPGQIFLVPHFDIMVRLKLTNSVTALWLPKIFSAFGTFMLRQFFMTQPKALDEAAMIDGCSFFGIYARILLPLIKPALVSLAILTALSAFKDLMWPLIVNNSLDKMTLSAGLAMLIGEHTTYYPQVMAGSAMAVWPMIILFLIFQNQFIEGISATGIK